MAQWQTARSPACSNKSPTASPYAWPCSTISSAARPWNHSLRPRSDDAPEVPGRNDRMLLIKYGRVLDPATKTDATNDVLLDGARIAKIGANLSAPDAETFDATGLIVA